MSSVFNADKNEIPFFSSQACPEVFLGFREHYSEAHVPGRHLNAQDAAGIDIDESAVEKHARAAFFSYSGPLPLPLNRQVAAGPLVNLGPHNIREGFHALYALAKYRNSAQARELAEASIDTIFKYWSPDRDRDTTTTDGNIDRGWDTQTLQGKFGLELDSATFIVGFARSIGPLVKYYRATSYGPALQLAILLKEKALNEFFTESGEYYSETFGTHTHSATCVMSSLAQLADLTADSRLMNRVKAFYDNGLWNIRDQLGWVIESTDPGCNPDRGEVNNTGDILETALILGRWGYTECYHDAERILRCHLLPSQLRDVSFIQDPPNPDKLDGKKDIANRHLGAFGFPAPYGHEPIDIERVSFNMDIVGGSVDSLCEAYRSVTRFDQAGHWVNLLFDHQTDTIKVESIYTNPTLRITTTRPGPLFVRIPPWIDRQLVASGLDSKPLFANDYLFIATPPLNSPIELPLDLPIEQIVLKHRTRDIRVRLHGDQVAAMDNFGADLTFFEPID